MVSAGREKTWNFDANWFSLGVMFGGAAMCLSLYVLASMLHKNMTEDKPEQVLTPVVSKFQVVYV